jgi:hypothetical protein
MSTHTHADVPILLHRITQLGAAWVAVEVANLAAAVQVLAAARWHRRWMARVLAPVALNQHLVALVLALVQVPAALARQAVAAQHPQPQPQLKPAAATALLAAKAALKNLKPHPPTPANPKAKATARPHRKAAQKAPSPQQAK